MVYLLDADKTFINFSVDEGIAIINSINTTRCYLLEGNTVSLASTESRQGRFKFNNAVTLTIDEDNSSIFPILDIIKKGKWHVIIEDHQGFQYMANLDFPAFVTYEYQFNSSDFNTLTLTFAADSNYPTMLTSRNVSKTDTLKAKPCQLNMGRIGKLMMSESSLSLIEKTSDTSFQTIYTDGQWSSIDYNTSTLSFTESYDGNKYTHELKFSLPLSQYKSYWGSSLLDFPDNRYALLFDTSNNHVVASGFDMGYFPSYTIETKDSGNVINLTFKHIGERLLMKDGKIEDAVVRTDLKYYQPVKPWGQWKTSTCLDEYNSIYTILREVTAKGYKTDNYVVLQGWEDYFKDANITISGTYKESDDMGLQLTYPDSGCAIDTCKWLTNVPPIITISSLSASYTIKNGCDWTAEVPNNIQLIDNEGNILTKGEGGKTYTFKVKALKDESSTNRVTFKTTATSFGFTVKVESAEAQCLWLSGKSKITAEEQGIVYTINSLFTDNTANNIKIVNNPENLQMRVTGRKTLLVDFPEYNGLTDKTWQFTLSLDNRECTFNVVQTRKWYKRVNEIGYVCDGKDKYSKVAVYFGYDENNINLFESYEKGVLIETGSTDCQSEEVIYEVIEGYICSGSNKYEKISKFTSTDNGVTWIESGEYSRGKLIEAYSSDCDSSYFWKENGLQVCLDGDLYNQESKYHRNGSRIDDLGIVRNGSIIEYGSTKCLDLTQSWMSFTFAPITKAISGEERTQDILINMVTDGEWSVNWGDNSKTENGQASPNLSIRHTYGTGVSPTIILTGNVSEVSIYGMQNSFISGDNEQIFATSITGMNLTGATSLKVLKLLQEHDSAYTIQLSTNKLDTIDISTCPNLTTLSIMNLFGIDDFTFKPNNALMTLEITNDQRYWFNADRFNSFLLSLPTSDPTIIYACPLTNSEGNQITCLSSSAIDRAASRGWYLTNDCGCGQGSMRYRFNQTDDTTCDGWDKRYVTQLQSSTLSNSQWSAWADVSGKTRIGGLIEKNSPDCGYVSPDTFKWEVIGGVICEGYTSYKVEARYVSHDGGNTWYPTNERRKGDKIKDNDTQCGYIEDTRQYRWVEDGGTICEQEDPTSDLLIRGTYDKSLIINGVTPTLKYRNGNIPVVNADGTFAITKDAFGEMVDLSSLFEGVQWIETITHMNNLSPIVNMSSMFKGSSIKAFDPLTNGKGNPININSMFENCNNMVVCNMQSFGNQRVNEYNRCWMNCDEMTDLNITGWQLTYDDKWDNVMLNCTKAVITNVGATEETKKVMANWKANA